MKRFTRRVWKGTIHELVCIDGVEYDDVEIVYEHDGDPYPVSATWRNEEGEDVDLLDQIMENNWRWLLGKVEEHARVQAQEHAEALRDDAGDAAYDRLVEQRLYQNN